MWEVFNRRLRGGFTLIELLVVIAIIAIVSASGYILLVKTNFERGRDGRRQADLESIRAALEIYRSDIGGYPGGTSTDLSSFLAPDYIQAIPKDPSTGRVYFYEGLDATGFSCSADCPRYQLCASLERTPTAPAVCGGGTGCDSGSGAVCNYLTQNP